MAIEPAAISASPAVTIRLVVLIAPDKPAASAKGTVSPSDIPITMSLTISEPVKCRSMWGVFGMKVSPTASCKSVTVLQRLLGFRSIEQGLYDCGFLLRDLTCSNDNSNRLVGGL